MHGGNLQEVSADECAACHLPDYQATREPDHVALSLPQLCDSCHGDDFWRPPLAPGLHPDDAFRISGGPHRPFACEECHDAALEDVPSAQGQNTDCVGCHTGAHARGKMDDVHEEVDDYPFGDAPPNFCLDCHPDGRKE